MISKKLLLLGDIGVGKTSLVRRLVLDELPSDYQPTLSADIYRYVVADLPTGSDAGRELELVIWDIDGNLSGTIFQHAYSKGASAALIVGDAMRPSTLETMASLGEQYRSAWPGRHFSYVVNKLDLVPAGESVALPQALVAQRRPVRMTSALSGENVRAAFADIAGIVLRREG